MNIILILLSYLCIYFPFSYFKLKQQIIVCMLKTKKKKKKTEFEFTMPELNFT